MAVAIIKPTSALIRGDGVDITIDVDPDGFVIVAQDWEVICMGRGEAEALYETLGLLLHQ